MTSRILLSAMTIALCTGAWAETPLRLLYLTKSAGFEHGPVKRDGDQPAYSERIMAEIAEKMGATITITKDAGFVNADNLKNYDVVIFYTSGDLTEPGTDGHPPMGPNGQAELLAWVKAGGGFLGIHSANDSFHSKDGVISPYVDMIGGEFKTHGKQFKGSLRVTSPGHPAIASLEDGWSFEEEWYISENLNTKTMHVLALLDPGSERKRQKMYNIPNYPIIWCSAYGDGRVLYNALGHREDVWDSPKFQQLVIDNLLWASGKGALMADPNYDAVVPKAIEESQGNK